MSKPIELSQGLVAIVDDDMYEYLSLWKWSAQRHGHIFYAISRDGGRKSGKRIYMHRVVMNASPGECVDHISGDALNNQRSNLRLCTRSENGCNRGVPRNNTSGWKGVSWHSKMGKWQAVIRVHRKQIYLGTFTDPIEAIVAYNAAASKFHGVFAYLNNIDSHELSIHQNPEI